jgi:hypothetical protein
MALSAGETLGVVGWFQFQKAALRSPRQSVVTERDCSPQRRFFRECPLDVTLERSPHRGVATAQEPSIFVRTLMSAVPGLESEPEVHP